jgi:NADPH:quinone reductase-like Zn-dependent oxidoreductase
MPAAHVAWSAEDHRIEVPAMPEDGVLVRVRASSADPVDLYALTRVVARWPSRSGRK